VTRKSEKRVRRPDHGDFEEGSPMAEAVDRFRMLAQLHLSAPDDALVRYAHGDGYERPGAALVRTVFAASGVALPQEATEEPSAACDHGCRTRVREGGRACVDCGEWFPEAPEDCQLESFVVEQIVRSPVLEDVEEFSVTDRLGFRPVTSEDEDEDESILY
jgi:hypothetical protein